MKSIFYILLFSQLLNFLGVFAEKVKEDSSGMNSVIWEKVEENKSKPLKKIIWKSYKSDENYFKNQNKQGFQLIKFLVPNQPRLSLLLGPSWKNWQLYGEMLIGAGGGGGVDSGSALLYKPSVGAEYQLSDDFSLQTGIGKVISKEGNLDANTFDVSLVWRFGTPK